MKAITQNRPEAIKPQPKVFHRPKVVWLLIGMQVFLAIGALSGGGAFILAPDGHLIQMPFSHLQKSPFPNFLIPGILLFVFLGIYPLLIAYSLWKQPGWHWLNFINPFKHIHWSWAGSLAAGVIVLVWITVEIFWVPFGFAHIFFLVYGVVLTGVTLLPNVRINYSRYPG
jgi:hypothetical protein